MSAHNRALKIGGGRPGVRHLDSVQAAIGRPYSGYHRSIAKKAAVLVEGVAGGHGFTDGNKRTSIILMDLLTYRSGYRLTLLKTDGNPGEVLENLVIDLVCHRLRLGEVVSWFEKRLRRFDSSL